MNQSLKDKFSYLFGFVKISDNSQQFPFLRKGLGIGIKKSPDELMIRTFSKFSLEALQTSIHYN